MIMINNIIVKWFNVGVAKLHLPLGTNIADYCKNLYFAILEKDFNEKLNKEFSTNEKLKIVSFEANGESVEFRVDILEEESSNYIYFKWLKSYFHNQANKFLPKLGYDFLSKTMKVNLEIKNMPDEEYIVNYNPYLLFVATVIAKRYKECLNNGMTDEEATDSASSIYDVISKNINVSFECIMDEIKLYI